MPNRKPGPSHRDRKAAQPGEATGTLHSTMSGPSTAQPTASKSKGGQAALAEKFGSTGEVAAAVLHNPLKAREHGHDNAIAPSGRHAGQAALAAGRGEHGQRIPSVRQAGHRPPQEGVNATIRPLDGVRVDAGARHLTTNQGTAVGDNQNSLKQGLRGPTLMEDFILREKITHFDHERIPERVVHARGSGAHGYFECYEALTDITRAAPFAEAGKRTPVFVRFSTVAGERGSADTVRDVRGFAVKFYTDEGNWDLVGNNIPVFFIQDAMKFPDVIHAVKPEPHHAMPQASSAHDTFWDFVSLMPESVHMQMWVMSDRAIPRSYRMMQGFGVHSFRLVNARGDSVFCKFHWSPLAGTHSLALGRGGEDRRRRRRLPSPRPVGGDRGRRLPRVGAGSADLHRGAGRAIQLRHPRSHEDHPRGAGAAAARWASWCSTATPTTSSPRPSRSRSAPRTSSRASTSATIRCLPGASTRTSTRRSRGSAARTSTRSRSTRRWPRCTTTSATACTGRRSTAAALPTSPIRWAADARSRQAARGS